MGQIFKVLSIIRWDLWLEKSAQAIGLELADFKCFGNGYINTSDRILMNQNA
jgi:hypothetical protein